MTDYIAWDDYLRSDGCEGLTFSDSRLESYFTAYEVWATDKKESSVIRDIQLSTSDLLPFLEKRRGSYYPPVSLTSAGDVRGSLRLLCHTRHLSQKLSGASLGRLPFSKDTFENISECMNLPPTFGHDLASLEGVPLRISRMHNGNYGIVCQLPPSDDHFVTLALTYNENEKTTTGFLLSQTSSSWIPSAQELLKHLQRLPSLAWDPLLVPTLLYSQLQGKLDQEHIIAGIQLREIQHEIGLMNPYLGWRRAKDEIKSFDDIHEKIILRHAYLTNGMQEYVFDLGKASLHAFGMLPWPRCSPDGGATSTGNAASEVRELETYCQYLHSKVTVGSQRRARYLRRLDVCLQVLYNLMQQHIARDTKRDASAMKSISLLAMVFMPVTAVATVMAPFSDPDGVTFTLNKYFWLFWAVAGPITFLTLLSWVLWLYRHRMPWRTRRKATHRRAPAQTVPVRPAFTSGQSAFSVSMPDPSLDTVPFRDHDDDVSSFRSIPRPKSIIARASPDVLDIEDGVRPASPHHSTGWLTI